MRRQLFRSIRCRAENSPNSTGCRERAAPTSGAAVSDFCCEFCIPGGRGQRRTVESPKGMEFIQGRTVMRSFGALQEMTC